MMGQITNGEIRKCENRLWNTYQLKKLYLFLLLIFFTLLLAGVTMAGITNHSYNDFVLRPDSKGDHINAHHGGIIFANGKYWWYGQTFKKKSSKKGGQTTDIGVIIYSSKDLLDWKYENVILGCEPSGDLKGSMRFERAKIIYNEDTKKFVMWFHYVKTPGKHGTKVGTGDAGVATCDTINGTYKWHGYHRPLGPEMTVKDCSLFKDEDGTAYFIFDSYPIDRSIPRCLYIAKLSDDFLKAVEVRKIPNTVHREAPAMIKKDEYYFLITSGTTGWKPNPAKYYRASNIWGPYEELGNFCLGKKKKITYNAQSTYILELQNRPGSYIFMGDRWNKKNMKRSAHIWLPLEFPAKDTVSMRYYNKWDLSIFDSNETSK